MPKYMLLLYNDPSNLGNVSPEEMQKATEKYMAWSKQPFTLDGKRLGQDAGKVIRLQNGKARTTDGPYSETKARPKKCSPVITRSRSRTTTKP